MIEQPITRPHPHQVGAMIAQVFQNPVRRMISVRSYNDKGKSGTFFLSFPRMIFGFKYRNITSGIALNELYVGFLKDNSKEVFLPTMLNVFAEPRLYGRVCNGNSLGESCYVNVQEMCSIVIDKFWSSHFNYSLFQCFVAYQPNLLNSHRIGDDSFCMDAAYAYFTNWQAKTKADPIWVPNDFLPIANPAPELVLVPEPI